MLSSCNSCSNYEVSLQSLNDENETNDKPTLNVFIENSGSMDGFFAGKSDLRDDIYGYISRLKNSTSQQNFFYINSQILPTNKSLEDFFLNLNASAFKAGGGNRAHSDIIDMMKMMLAKSKLNTVTMFVSDCILDLPSVDTKAFVGFKKTSLANTIQEYKKDHKGFGMRVLCMLSNFDGFLYPTNKQAIKTTGKRPYYIWIFGSNQMIAKLMQNNSDATLGNNLIHTIAYSDITSMPVNIGKTKGAMSKNRKVKLKSGNPKFDLYANLSRTLLDEKSRKDIRLYDISPFLKIEGIEKITYSGSKYTEVFHISLTHASKADIGKLTIKKEMPKWVEDMNDETGDKSKTTCGIKYLIQGIEEAFSDVPPLTINFKITKK